MNILLKFLYKNITIENKLMHNLQEKLIDNNLIVTYNQSYYFIVNKICIIMNSRKNFIINGFIQLDSIVKNQKIFALNIVNFLKSFTNKTYKDMSNVNEKELFNICKFYNIKKDKKESKFFSYYFLIEVKDFFN